MPKYNTPDLRAEMVRRICLIYDMEHRLASVLQEMAELATDKQLKSMLVDHRDETNDQIHRLDELSQLMDMDFSKEESAVTKTMIEEAKAAISGASDPNVRDTIIALSASEAEHLEIATYTGVIAMANYLKFTEEKKILKENLKEEKSTARKIDLAIKLLVRLSDGDKSLL